MVRSGALPVTRDEKEKCEMMGPDGLLAELSATMRTEKLSMVSLGIVRDEAGELAVKNTVGTRELTKLEMGSFQHWFQAVTNVEEFVSIHLCLGKCVPVPIKKRKCSEESLGKGGGYGGSGGGKGGGGDGGGGGKGGFNSADDVNVTVLDLTIFCTTCAIQTMQVVDVIVPPGIDAVVVAGPSGPQPNMPSYSGEHGERASSSSEPIPKTDLM